MRKESWISDQGFETPLKIGDDEAKEVARRVHEAVEEAAVKAEEVDGDDDEDDGDGDDIDAGDDDGNDDEDDN